jgi:uncharacterized protein with PIN domain
MTRRSPGFEANLQAAADFVTQAILDATPRAILIERRRTEYPAKHGADYPDFSPADGRCYVCNADLVGLDYPTRFISRCPNCGRSFCE